MLLAAVLSLLIGLTLGLLGGGGSILAVPALVYALGIDVPTAIAMSLLVVGVTCFGAMLPRARAGEVDIRVGLTFGVAGMIAAYLGGRLARYVAPGVLLVLFALVMLMTATAMLHDRPVSSPKRPRAPSALTTALIGSVVGLVTGLVGAGGGFLVVPALVLLAGLEMPRAIATALFIIALQAFAGFAGHASHVKLPWAMTGVVTAIALVGSLAGRRLAGLFDERGLRRLFAGFVMLIALFLLARQLPESVRASALFQAAFVQRWPFWVGGSAIALIIAGLLYFDNRLLGVSTGCAELCESINTPALRSSWRLRFLGGIVLGGAVSAIIALRPPSLVTGLSESLVSGSPLRAGLLLLAGGVFIGAGARLAGGCTSGHGIVGVAQGARSSLAATLAFMVAGFLTTWVLFST